MAENVSVHIDVTGAEAAAKGVRDFAKSLQAADKAQQGAAKSAKAMADSTAAASKVLDNLVKTVAKLDGALKTVNTELRNTARTAKTLSSANERVTTTGRQAAGALKGVGTAAAGAGRGMRDLGAAEEQSTGPTLAMTQALERQTRQLAMQREATIKAMGAQTSFVERMASSAPKLNKFSLYLAGGALGGAYAGIKQYMDLNKQITQTFSQANVEISKQAALTTNVRNIAKETGRSYHDVADALYRVASATSAWHGGRGASTKELTTLTRETANLQVLGNLQTGAQSDQASRVIGAIANANLKDFSKIKDPTKRAHAIGAAVNAVVGAGDLRMTDLISALGRGVEASAKSVGVSFKDTGAFIDLLTSRGVSGSSAGTYVAHAFQLLAGSTKQGRDWQAAMGLGSGEMLHIMQSKGLAPAVETLASHMTQLKSVEYMRYGGLTGQAAAEKMMIAAGLDPALVKDWESGALKDPSRRKDLKAVEQAAMTAMFGGGRQAMPIMSLIQATKKGSFQDIVKKVQDTSNQSTYTKDIKLAMNTPAQQQAQLMRKMQDQLVTLGQKLTPIWLGILKAGNGVLNFMGKFKAILYELAGIAAALIGAMTVRYAAKAAIGIRNTFGAMSYYGKKSLAGVTGKFGETGEAYANRVRGTITGNMEDPRAKRTWAGRYAESKKLEYSQYHTAQQAEIRHADQVLRQADRMLEVMGSAESSATLFGEAAHRMGSQLATTMFRMEQLFERINMTLGENAIAGEAGAVFSAVEHRGMNIPGGINMPPPELTAKFKRLKDKQDARKRGLSSSLWSNVSGGSTSTRAAEGINRSGSFEKTLVEETRKNGSHLESIKGFFGRMTGGVSGAMSTVGGGIAGGGRGLLGMGGKLLGSLGGLAMGPWGMAAMMAAPIVIPAVTSFVSNIFKKGPKYGTDNKGNAQDAPGFTTPGAFNKKLKDFQKNRDAALARGDYEAYNHWKTQIKSLKSTATSPGSWDPTTLNATVATQNATATNNLLNEVVKGQGRHGGNFFKIGGKLYNKVKIGGKWISASDVNRDFWTGDYKHEWAAGTGSANIAEAFKQLSMPKDPKHRSFKDWKHEFFGYPNAGVQYSHGAKNMLEVLDKITGKIDYTKNKNFSAEFTGKPWKYKAQEQAWIEDARRHPGNTAQNRSRFEYLSHGADQLTYSARLEKSKAMKSWQSGDVVSAATHMKAADKLKNAADDMKQHAKEFAKGAKFHPGEIEKMSDQIGSKTAEKVAAAVKEGMVQASPAMINAITSASINGQRLVLSALGGGSGNNGS